MYVRTGCGCRDLLWTSVTTTRGTPPAGDLTRASRDDVGGGRRYYLTSRRKDTIMRYYTATIGRRAVVCANVRLCTNRCWVSCSPPFSSSRFRHVQRGHSTPLVIQRLLHLRSKIPRLTSEVRANRIWYTRRVQTRTTKNEILTFESSHIYIF